MPTYDYECRACAHRFEHRQGMTEPVLRKCPACGKLKLVRLISGGAGVIFKGSGFYETDYKRNRPNSESGSDERKKDEASAAKAAENADAPAPKPDAKKAEAKGESKSDAKSGAKAESKSETKSETRRDAKPDSSRRRDSGPKKD